MALAFVREVGIRLEVVERGVANDAARTESFDTFERPILVAVLGEVLSAMVLVVALGDRDSPLAVDLLDGAGGDRRDSMRIGRR